MNYPRKAIGSLAMATLLAVAGCAGITDRAYGTSHYAWQPAGGQQFSDAGRAHRPAGNAPAGRFRRPRMCRASQR